MAIKKTDNYLLKLRRNTFCQRHENVCILITKVDHSLMRTIFAASPNATEPAQMFTSHRLCSAQPATPL